MDLRVKHKDDSDRVERPRSPFLVMPDLIGHPLEFDSMVLRVKHKDDRVVMDSRIKSENDTLGVE